MHVLLFYANVRFDSQREVASTASLARSNEGQCDVNAQLLRWQKMPRRSHVYVRTTRCGAYTNAVAYGERRRAIRYRYETARQQVLLLRHKRVRCVRCAALESHVAALKRARMSRHVVRSDGSTPTVVTGQTVRAKARSVFCRPCGCDCRYADKNVNRREGVNACLRGGACQAVYTKNSVRHAVRSVTARLKARAPTAAR